MGADSQFARGQGSLHDRYPRRQPDDARQRAGVYGPPGMNGRDMKVDELRGVDQVRDLTFRQASPYFAADPAEVANPRDPRYARFALVDKLVALGFEPMGHGAYGSVLQHPHLKYVVKVFRQD